MLSFLGYKFVLLQFTLIHPALLFFLANFAINGLADNFLFFYQYPFQLHFIFLLQMNQLLIQI